MTEPKTKWIVELEPGVYLRHGPVLPYIRTSKQHKAERYDSVECAENDIRFARAQSKSKNYSDVFSGAKIVEVTECLDDSEGKSYGAVCSEGLER